MALLLIGVALPFRESGHHKITLALDPNLHLNEQNLHFYIQCTLYMKV